MCSGLHLLLGEWNLPQLYNAGRVNHFKLLLSYLLLSTATNIYCIASFCNRQHPFRVVLTRFYNI